MDRLVAVEGDDRSTFIAVDAPTKVDVVAERAPPVLVGISGTMRRMGPLLREQRPETAASPVPLRVPLVDLRLRNPKFDRGADVLGNCGLMHVFHLSRLGSCTSIASVPPRVIDVVARRAAPVPRHVPVRPGVLAQLRLRVARPCGSRLRASFTFSPCRKVQVLAALTDPVF